ILPALAAAAIARMTSYPRALVAGVCLGMVEQVLLWSNTYSGQTQTALFAVVLLVLLLLRGVGGRAEPTGAWSAVTVARPLPRELSQLWSVRLLPTVVAAAVVAFIAWRGLSSEAAAFAWTPLVAALVIAMSAGLITGLGGELSLGQYAIAGVG